MQMREVVNGGVDYTPRERTYPGLFIAFEGADGVGKSTQIEYLRQNLAAAGHEVLVTREPGGTELGAALRQLLLYSGQVCAQAELLMFAADKAQHIETLVLPALEAGQVVITDRYVDSAIAYQGEGRGLGAEDTYFLNAWATGGLRPDITVWLDLEVEAAAARVGESKDRMEQAGREFFVAVRERFARLAAADPRYLRVDAGQGREEIAAEIWAQVRQMQWGNFS